MADLRIGYHQDASLFRDALRFTAVETRFSERLIEKDYHCSVVLADLATTGLVFKGGTCLSKVHADFCRLSEDLDFCVSTPVDATRNQRRRQIDAFKSHFSTIEDRLDALRIVEPLRGFNNSTQYGGRLAYQSSVTGQDDFIKIEVSIREPVVEAVEHLGARTLLTDPFRGAPAVALVEISVLSVREAYAEKLRAALSRRQPAIRDFFDLGHAISSGIVKVGDERLIEILEEKMAVPGAESVDMSPTKLNLLRTQLDAQLKPVLRPQDFLQFDLDLAFSQIAKVAALIV